MNTYQGQPANKTNRNKRAKRPRFGRQIWILSVIVSLIMSVLALSQNPASASETDGVDISCPAGTTLDESTTSCRSTTTTPVEPETKTNYSCPDDAAAVPGTSGADLECVERVQRSVRAVAKTTYTCPAGSLRSSGAGATLKCTRTGSRMLTSPATANTTYSCPSGYVLKSTPTRSCTRTVTRSSTTSGVPTTTYSCPPLSIRTGVGASTTCIHPFLGVVPPIPRTTYSCPPGTTSQTGSGASLRCTTKTTQVLNAPVRSVTTYSCPSGYTKSGTGTATKCTRVVLTFTPVQAVKKTTYSCPPPSTEKSGSGATLECETTVETNVDPEQTTSYFCPDGSVAVDDTSGAGLRCQATTGNEVPANITCGGRTVTVNLNQGEKPTRGHDVILGTQGPDTINAKKGDDIICGWGGNDTIKGAGGADTIFGGNGNDKVKGGGGKDNIYGGQDNDILEGGGGKDVIHGGNGNDAIDGGKGKDTGYGEGGDDTVNGGGGRDTLHGGDGTDTCDGGPGKNKIGATCEN